MEWSPIHPSAQGSSSGLLLRWVCRSFGSSTSMQDIPALPAVSCFECSASAAIVINRPTGRTARFCLSCQFLVPTPAPPPDNDPPSDWFSHGPLRRFALRLVATPLLPALATQSWLFCPLISLGLALAESRMGVLPYSTGNRDSEQSQFWTADALTIIVHTLITFIRWTVANLQLYFCSLGNADI